MQFVWTVQQTFVIFTFYNPDICYALIVPLTSLGRKWSFLLTVTPHNVETSFPSGKTETFCSEKCCPFLHKNKQVVLLCQPCNPVNVKSTALTNVLSSSPYIP